MKTVLRAVAIGAALCAGTAAHAGIPVIDAANLANSVQQVVAWGKQYEQMVSQITQLKQQYDQAVKTYNSVSGIRGMADLVNNRELRGYLPGEWQQTMRLLSTPGRYEGLSGSVSAIRDAAKIASLADTGLKDTSTAGRALVAAQNQAATNRALGEEGYRQASERINSLQTLLDKVNDAPDSKDIMDLQARIAAEQAMLQNENIKLALMAQLQQAQRDMQAQQAREIAMQSSRGTVPRFTYTRPE